MSNLFRFAPAIIAGLFLVTACGESGGSEGGLAVRTAAAEAETGIKTGDRKFDEAINCWALTNAAYFAHVALGSSQTGNVPNPEPVVYMTWSKEMALMAHDKGMSYTEYQDLQAKAQKPTRLYTLEVEPDMAKAIQTCIDKTPPMSERPDPSWPG